MAVPFSNTKLRVPKGFQNILEGLAREVLRNQPGDIYAFGAIYFENLMKAREEGGIDPATHGAQMEDRFYNNKSFQQPDVDPNDPGQQDAALKIQTKYRQHHAKAVVQEKRQEKAAVTIQAGYRGFQDRKRVDDMKQGIESEGHKAREEAADEPKEEKTSESKTEEAEPAANEEEEVDIDLNDPEVEKAAFKIQAGFKGFKARREVSAMKEETKEEEKAQEIPAQEEKAQEESKKEEEEEIDIDLNDPEVGKAAEKIQAGFKGFKTRKEMREKKEEEVSKEEPKAEEEEIDIDLEDPEVSKAAAKIQAGFRGHQTRKDIAAKKQADSATKEEAPAEEEKKEAEEEVDIDLSDPDVEKAAGKIQAGFRGMQARKEVQKMKEDNEGEEPKEEGKEEDKKEEEEVDIDLNDPDVAAAASKIQAGFRGMQTRKQVGAMKADGEEGPPTENGEAAPVENGEAAPAEGGEEKQE